MLLMLYSIKQQKPYFAYDLQTFSLIKFLDKHKTDFSGFEY